MQRRIKQNTKDVKPVWITQEIKKRSEIGKRRIYNKLARKTQNNKLARKTQNTEENERYDTLYQTQKNKVKLMVRDAISVSKKKITMSSGMDKTKLPSCGIA